MILSTKQDICLPVGIEARLLQSVVVLLVTVNVNETLAAHGYLQPLNGHKHIYQFSKIIDEGGQQPKTVIYYIGRYGNCPAAITDAQPGFEIHGSASSLVVMADKCFSNLGVIISVGIACGIKNKVKMFDVLVSSKLINYMKANNEHGGYLQKRETITVSPQLTKLFTQLDDWPIDHIKKRLNDSGMKLPNVKSGTILSGPYIDDPAKKEALIEMFGSEPIGIEEDRAQLFVESQQTSINTIFIKAVYEFGDGIKNSKEYQPTAALLAADLVHRCLCNPQAHEIFRGLQNYFVWLIVNCTYLHNDRKLQFNVNEMATSILT